MHTSARAQKFPLEQLKTITTDAYLPTKSVYVTCLQFRFRVKLSHDGGHNFPNSVHTHSRIGEGEGEAAEAVQVLRPINWGTWVCVWVSAGLSEERGGI